MSSVAAAVVGGAVVGGYLQGEANKDAAKTQAQGAQAAATQQVEAARIAADAQLEAARLGSSTQLEMSQSSIDEQRRQFEHLQSLFAPYIQSGTRGLSGLEALTGTMGAGAQQAAIAGLDQSPQMMAMMQQGENAMLQNASATGGLRGGNLQAAMAQFRPQMLSDMINQQYGRLGNLTQLGQSSAAGQGTAGMNMASNIGNSQLAAGQAAAQAAQSSGSAIAQSALQQGNAMAQAAQSSAAAQAAAQQQQGQIYGNTINQMVGAYGIYKGAI